MPNERDEAADFAAVDAQEGADSDPTMPAAGINALFSKSPSGLRV